MILSGWKDEAYFYGDSDSYMTLPATARERNLLKRTEDASRGYSFSSDQAYEDDDGENDLDGTSGMLSEEDALLPNYAPYSLLSLPNILRQDNSTLCKTMSGIDLFVYQDKKVDMAKAMMDLLSKNVFCSDSLVHKRYRYLDRWNDRHFDGCEQSYCEAFADYIPMLRSMAFQVFVAEGINHSLSNYVEEYNNRKPTTRRSKLLRREHYFERFHVPSAEHAHYNTAQEIGIFLAGASLLCEQ